MLYVIWKISQQCPSLTSFRNDIIVFVKVLSTNRHSHRRLSANFNRFYPQQLFLRVFWKLVTFYTTAFTVNIGTLRNAAISRHSKETEKLTVDAFVYENKVVMFTFATYQLLRKIILTIDFYKRLTVFRY